MRDGRVRRAKERVLIADDLQLSSTEMTIEFQLKMNKHIMQCKHAINYGINGPGPQGLDLPPRHRFVDVDRRLRRRQRRRPQMWVATEELDEPDEVREASKAGRVVIDHGAHDRVHVKLSLLCSLQLLLRRFARRR
jgi:hypothetical protein